MDLIPLLKTLTNTPGPSGLEHDIAAVIAELWQPFADEVTTDRIGNVIAIKHGHGDGPHPRVMLSAHMDEIGLMVSKVEGHNGFGFLRVINIGGIDLRQLYGLRVTVHGKKNITGVLAALPNSMLPSNRRGKAYNYDELVVDVGLSAETTKSLISIGDYITFQQDVTEMIGGNIVAKALDNRACVAALTLLLEQLQGVKHEWDVVVVGTVQEETRLLGGYTAAFAQKPDLAVALDTCFAKQPSVSTADTFPLGSGPVLDIGVHVHPGVRGRLVKAASALEMSTVTLPHARSSGTETGAIQLTQAGIPTALVSILIRSMHTVVEMINAKDIKRTARLLAQFVADLDGDVLGKLSESFLEKASSEKKSKGESA